VLVIDSLEDVLPQIGRYPGHPGCHADRDGTVRLIQPVPGRDTYLDLMFTGITACGLGPAALRADPAGPG
jgi:hypothetical protein